MRETDAAEGEDHLRGQSLMAREATGLDRVTHGFFDFASHLPTDENLIEIAGKYFKKAKATN